MGLHGVQIGRKYLTAPNPKTSTILTTRKASKKAISSRRSAAQRMMHQLVIESPLTPEHTTIKVSLRLKKFKFKKWVEFKKFKSKKKLRRTMLFPSRTRSTQWVPLVATLAKDKDTNSIGQARKKLKPLVTRLTPCFPHKIKKSSMFPHLYRKLFT